MKKKIFKNLLFTVPVIAVPLLGNSCKKETAPSYLFNLYTSSFNKSPTATREVLASGSNLYAYGGEFGPKSKNILAVLKLVQNPSGNEMFTSFNLTSSLNIDGLVINNLSTYDVTPQSTSFLLSTNDIRGTQGGQKYSLFYGTPPTATSSDLNLSPILTGNFPIQYAKVETFDKTKKGAIAIDSNGNLYVNSDITSQDKTTVKTARLRTNESDTSPFVGMVVTPATDGGYVVTTATEKGVYRSSISSAGVITKPTATLAGAAVGKINNIVNINIAKKTDTYLMSSKGIASINNDAATPVITSKSSTSEYNCTGMAYYTTNKEFYVSTNPPATPTAQNKGGLLVFKDNTFTKPAIYNSTYADGTDEKTGLSTNSFTSIAVGNNGFTYLVSTLGIYYSGL